MLSLYFSLSVLLPLSLSPSLSLSLSLSLTKSGFLLINIWHRNLVNYFSLMLRFWKLWKAKIFADPAFCIRSIQGQQPTPFDKSQVNQTSTIGQSFIWNTIKSLYVCYFFKKHFMHQIIQNREISRPEFCTLKCYIHVTFKYLQNKVKQVWLKCLQHQRTVLRWFQCKKFVLLQ